MDAYRMGAAPGGSPLTLGELGIVPRILLATDGTLTHILEAYADEPVYLVKLSHSLVTDPAARRPFDLAEGERALRRVILLRGARTHATFIHADSVVMLDRLPPGMADALLYTERPIGKLLAEHRAETFREIIAMWEESNEGVAAHFDVRPLDPLLARAYRIMGGGRPLAWITESFPEKFQLALRRETSHRRDRRATDTVGSSLAPVNGGAGDAA